MVTSQNVLTQLLRYLSCINYRINKIVVLTGSFVTVFSGCWNWHCYYKVSVNIQKKRMVQWML